MFKKMLMGLLLVGGAWMTHGAAARGVGRCAPMNS